LEVIIAGQNQEWYRKSYRTPYLTTYVRLSPALVRKVCKVRDILRRVDSRQIYSPSSYLHVTLKELGWLGEEIRKEKLPDALRIVREVASEQAPFDLEVEGIGIFPDVIYGRVGRGVDEIRRMNAKLVQRLGDGAIRRWYDGENMKPHVSMVHFTTRDVEPLLGKAKELENRFVGKMKVREIQVKKSYPHRLFEKQTGVRPRVVNEPLTAFELGH
jgi:2'-5' RNA ligase